MLVTPTEEQQKVIEEELGCQCVMACAGSGKTFTAVRRLLEMRKRLHSRAYVALLSHSNVAVDTFRKEFAQLARLTPGLSDRVLISTIDAFIDSHILLPHASRLMGCNRRPFLVNGAETFLKGFMFYNGNHNVGIQHLKVSLTAQYEFIFSDGSFYGSKIVDSSIAENAIKKLGKVGGYTHEFARYWSVLTILESDRLIDMLALRYPHILVDEAQDINSIHGLLLDALQGSGSTLSLIGDPNQAIYEFAGADGGFLKKFNVENNVKSFSIKSNRRSLSQIVTVANALSMGDSNSVRAAPARKHGAYYFCYKPGEIDKLTDIFLTIIQSNSYEISEAAILCRGNDLVDKISGGAESTGTGATEKFACASIKRDKDGDIAIGFEFVVDGISKLLDRPPNSLRHDILSYSSTAEIRGLRRIVWAFLRSSDTGLPKAFLRGKTEWLPLLKARVQILLKDIELKTHFKRSDTWSNNITARDLTDDPLWQGDIASLQCARVRVRTVHKVKGEGIDAVMYVTKKSDLESLLGGTTTEEGRIGYVAISRARDLLILAVPSNAHSDQLKGLESKGFLPWV